jgi:large subunit ribosomal protein L6
MSRVGKMPIVIPDKVKVRLENGTIFVEGPKGKLNFSVPNQLVLEVTDKEIVIKRKAEDRNSLALHGTARALINNMVVGVSEGFSKTLEIIGVGYKAEAKGREIVLQLGYSHPVHFPLPEGIEAKVDKQTRVTVSGFDKQLLGEVAAQIRGFRPPEPYKGKGIRYAGEYVKRKVGKAAISAAS